MKPVLSCLLLIMLLSLLFAACAKRPLEADEGEAGTGPGGPEIGKYGEGQGGAAYGEGAGKGRYGTGDASELTGDPQLDDPNSPLFKRIIYFMYDSSEIAPEYQRLISAHAGFLGSNPERTVVLEGHADERGSPEYNIALGEQRANSVARLLKLQGTAEGQVQVVSFGEEKPAVEGHDESAWQQNRRVEIIYSRR
jgi:peptidoglycan-associated lipoprotein